MANKKKAPAMTDIPDFARSHEEACEKEGHLMNDDGNSVYCLRCPYIEE